uniref:Uncharacterized protein n=1 Tax=Arundo donax TaxID=35708 RepID=A0A0A9BLR6_ARUDO
MRATRTAEGRPRGWE